jgi:hypothetical protein
MEPGIITTNVIGLISLAAIGLAIAAWRYNRTVSQLEAAGHHQGYVWLLVAAGCAVILLVALAAVWPLGPQARLAVVITAGLFVPAGIPMILGSIRRHVAARAAEQQRLHDEAADTIRREIVR